MLPAEVSHRPGSCRAGILDAGRLDALLEAVRARGWTVLGPQVRDGAIVYDTLGAASELPVDWRDEQSGGHYRLKRRGDGALFGYTVGPHSWKRYLFPAEQRLFRARRTADGIEFLPEPIDPPRLAFLGVRACELRALAIQDRVFLGGEHVDPGYKARRERVFVIAVNCGQAGGTCFCLSMGSGPKATTGFDIALTELMGEGGHRFLVEAGSERGSEVVSGLGLRPAEASDLGAAEAAIRRAESQMGRALETDGIRELLQRTLEHGRWDEVAGRCLSCANCTLACPTCFCSTVEEVTDLTGEHAERWRKWDSCFTLSFSYVVGGSVRGSVKGRYRQWLTHKLGTWIDQFGESGCVGCGRCITWCPVGIDLTEEVRALRGPGPGGDTAGGGQG